MFPYDHYVTTEVGILTWTVKMRPSILRACVMTGAFASNESICVIGCENMEKTSDLLKVGTKSLAVLHAIQDFSLDSLSDTITIAAMFRAWYRSPVTAREDGRPKFWISLLRGATIPSTWVDNDFTNEDFVACHKATFDRIDEDMYDILLKFVTNNRGRGFTDKFRMLRDDELRKVCKLHLIRNFNTALY